MCYEKWRTIVYYLVLQNLAGKQKIVVINFSQLITTIFLGLFINQIDFLFCTEDMLPQIILLKLQELTQEQFQIIKVLSF